MRIFLVTISTAILMLCLTGLGFADAPTKPEIIGHQYQDKPFLNRGDIGPDGNLVIYSWPYGYRTLDGYYGMMIWYNQYQESSKPEYELFNQTQKTIQKTDDLSEFLSWLTKIPKGSSIYFYNLCSAGSHYGLDPNILKQIEDQLKKNGITLLDLYGICTCP